MKVLAITGGHSYDRRAFEELLRQLPGEVTWVEQPEATALYESGGAREYAVSLHYDMPGVRPVPEPPSAQLVAGLDALVRAGHGFVVLHHALASWPSWGGWSDLVGGQYLYEAGSVRGRHWPDSGFRHEVAQRLTPADPHHPVVAGLEAGLELVDETYLCPVFEDEVTPLLLTDAPIDDTVHTSTVAAMAAREGRAPDGPPWRHPAGPPLAAWCKENGASRLVYVQPGDTAATLSHPAYQRLVSNALRWAGRET